MKQLSSTWKGQRVLVTGATGFVGGWLVKRLLAEEAKVTAFVLDFDPQSEFIRSGDHKKTSIVSGNLIDFAACERAIVDHEVEVVFHLAAQALVEVGQAAPHLTFESNVRGTYNLLEACRLHPHNVKSIMVASSDKAYGTSSQLPYVENMALAGRNPYDASKSCTDLIAQSYAHSYQMPIVVSRFGNIYGGGDLHWSRIVPGTIRSILNGERPVLRSDGTFVRDYVYAEDVVEGYLALAARAQDFCGEAFNLSGQEPVSVREIVNEILSLMGREDLEPVVLGQAQGEIHSQHLDASKAARMLEWKPKYSLQEGLKQTIEWYREHLNLSGQLKKGSAKIAESAL